MRLVAYRCEKCESSLEEIYKYSEKIPEKLVRKCLKCGEEVTFQKFNFKNNPHRVAIFDRGGHG